MVVVPHPHCSYVPKAWLTTSFPPSWQEKLQIPGSWRRYAKIFVEDLSPRGPRSTKGLFTSERCLVLSFSSGKFFSDLRTNATKEASLHAKQLCRLSRKEKGKRHSIRDKDKEPRNKIKRVNKQSIENMTTSHLNLVWERLVGKSRSRNG